MIKSLDDLAEKCCRIIVAAEYDGLEIDDGNVVDLCADNISASLKDIRTALASVPSLAARFPKAINR